LIEEILVLVCFSLAGGLSALTLWKHSERNLVLIKHRRNQAAKPFNATRSEIDTLQFEKEILSHSVTSIYEAVQNGKIGVIERDRLLLKYKSQLDAFNKKIGELQLSVDLTELSEMRSQLVSLLEERIAAIEGRLTEISQKCGMSLDSLVDLTKRKYGLVQPKVHINSEIAENKRITQKDSLPRVEDKDFQEVQHEIMQALTRLEHAGKVEDDIVEQVNHGGVAVTSSAIDVDKESHPHIKGRDALSFLNEAEIED
jgi:septation ring formation regulator EzrA